MLSSAESSIMETPPLPDPFSVFKVCGIAPCWLSQRVRFVDVRAWSKRAGQSKRPLPRVSGARRETYRDGCTILCLGKSAAAGNFEFESYDRRVSTKARQVFSRASRRSIAPAVTRPPSIVQPG
jgi:hypothetical protein